MERPSAITDGNCAPRVPGIGDASSRSSERFQRAVFPATSGSAPTYTRKLPSGAREIAGPISLGGMSIGLRISSGRTAAVTGPSPVARRRVDAMTAHATAPSATAHGSTVEARDLGRAASVVVVVRVAETLPVADADAGPPSSALAKSAALRNRSAGSLLNARWIAASTAAGTVGRVAVTGAGMVFITLATIACALGPVNGGSPASISYNTHPNA